ncbi:MAG: hypothetical protein ACFFD4_38985 [Candidatus Odinarchaeota archaeon]
MRAAEYHRRGRRGERQRRVDGFWGTLRAGHKPAWRPSQGIRPPVLDGHNGGLEAKDGIGDKGLDPAEGTPGRSATRSDSLPYGAHRERAPSRSVVELRP